jgi:hypothetical protein
MRRLTSARSKIIDNLQNCVITNRASDQGPVKALIGGIGGIGVIVRDNLGSFLII